MQIAMLGLGKMGANMAQRLLRGGHKVVVYDVDPRRATELAGIGPTIQEKVLALAGEGTIPAAAKLRAKFPPGLIEMTRLPGLGPKRARKLTA